MLGSEQPPAPSAALLRLTQTLAALRLLPDDATAPHISSRELADALWLAVQMGDAPVTSGWSRYDSRLPADDGATARDASSDDEPTGDAGPEGEMPDPAAAQQAPQPQAEVFPDTGAPGSGNRPARALRIPGVPRLPDPLGLSRALRPLRRRRPVAEDPLLDTEATAELHAANRLSGQRLWQPVWQPRQVPWLDLDLILDTGPSMRLWAPLAVDLHGLLRRSGAFGHIALWRLGMGPDGPSLITADLGAATVRGQDGPPRGQRLALIVSDAVSPGWYDSRLTELLTGLARIGPIALVQMLPIECWRDTALGLGDEVRLRLHQSADGAPLQLRLAVGARGPTAPKAPSAEPLLPILELTPGGLRLLARCLSGRAGAELTGRRVDAARWSAESPYGELQAQPSAEERIEAFLSIATPPARKLGGYLASVPYPLTLDIMRLIQASMEPQITLAHLAEVFTGGLLERHGGDDADPSYRFIGLPSPDAVVDAALTRDVRRAVGPIVRELRHQISPREAATVLRNISEHMRGLGRGGIDWRALLEDPTADGSQQVPQGGLDPDERPLALIGVDVLRGLGGGFLDRGNALLRAWPSAAALPAVTASAAEDPVGPASSIPHTDGLDSLLAELRDPETTPPRRLHIGDLLEMWEPDGDPRPGVGTVVAERQKSPRGARRYYNSEDADDIYFHLGGGEDIHIGLYQHVDDEITDASRRTVDFIADRLAAVLSKRNARVIDLGSGYGSAARTLAKRFGCRVLSLNLSEAENARNRQMNADAGLEHLIEVVGGSFEQIPVEDGSFDVAWSQDAILHSARREKVLEEIDRVLKPGGEFAFTDPMQVDDCPDGVLQPVLERMHLSSLGSFAAYRLQAQRLGWEEVAVIDMTDQLVTHYGRVAALLRAEGESLTAKVSDGYIERILQGLQHWIDAGRNGYLAWGLLHFRKPLYASEQSAEDDLGIRVVTVDDHSLLRAMVRQVLEEEQGFVIVGEAEDGAQALEVVLKLAPDVVSMGVNMPVMDGVLATEALTREGCVSRILGLSSRSDLQTVARFLEAGGAGFMDKARPATADDFRDGIRAVHQGRRWLDPTIRERVQQELDECFAGTSRNDSTGGHLVFAEREKRVIRMVVDCCNATEITSKLGISQKKLSILKAGIAEKLDPEKRAEAENNPCKAAEHSLIILRHLLLAEQA